MFPGRSFGLWLKWVAANTLGEMIGLGTTIAVLGLGLSVINGISGVLGILAGYGLAIITGILEATVVGWAQWRVLNPWLPKITFKAWWVATLIGALIAYCLGYLPSTIMSLQDQSTQSTAVESEQWVIFLLAAGMGLVGGLILSYYQWRVLRKHVNGSRVWLPANMLGWMLGMPLIFWGIDMAQKITDPAPQILLMVGVLLVTGAIVGAVHGVSLVQLVKKPIQAEFARTG